MNGLFYSVLPYIGPAADTVKYSYRLEFFKNEYKYSLSITLLASTFYEELFEVHNSGTASFLF